MTKRLLNDEEFSAFVATSIEMPWDSTAPYPFSLIAWAMGESPYGSDGVDGALYTYSSRAPALSELGSPEFPKRTLDQREYWCAPNISDWITPVFNEIANDALPGYNFKTYRLYEGKDGHTESVGVHPKTGDIVALGLNVPDIEDTLKDCGYPDTEYVDDDLLPDLLGRLDHIANPIHEQITLSIDENLEFEVDKGIAFLINACWDNGAPTVMSCENTDGGTASITFVDPLCADKFLFGIFAHGDIYWDGKKVDPADWKWKTYGPFNDKDGSTRNTVTVSFPPELIELLTENLTSEKSDPPADPPEPGEMISAFLPEVEEEFQRLFPKSTSKKKKATNSAPALEFSL